MAAAVSQRTCSCRSVLLHGLLTDLQGSKLQWSRMWACRSCSSVSELPVLRGAPRHAAEHTLVRCTPCHVQDIAHCSCLRSVLRRSDRVPIRFVISCTVPCIRGKLKGYRITAQYFSYLFGSKATHEHEPKSEHCTRYRTLLHEHDVHSLNSARD